jgi:hypothetical protein
LRKQRDEMRRKILRGILGKFVGGFFFLSFEFRPSGKLSNWTC